MITPTDVLDVMKKCSYYDTRFPKPSPGVSDAWMEHFNEFPLLTRELLLEAVKVYYKAHDPRVPLPSHISRIARDLWQDRYEREAIDGELHRMVEQRSEALAAPDTIEALPAPVNDDPAVVADRKAAIARFEFRPRPRVEHCQFCGTKLEESITGLGRLYLHPGGQLACPDAPRMVAEHPADGLEAPPEGDDTGEGPSGAEIDDEVSLT